jgi:hypothetical protein
MSRAVYGKEGMLGDQKAGGPLGPRLALIGDAQIVGREVGNRAALRVRGKQVQGDEPGRLRSLREGSQGGAGKKGGGARHNLRLLYPI